MRLFFVCILLMVLQFGITVFLAPSTYTHKQISIEVNSLHTTFGSTLANKAIDRANFWIWYFLKQDMESNLLVKTDVGLKLQIPSGFSSISKRDQLFYKVYPQPKNLRPALYQVLLRLSLISVWMPLLLVLCVILVIEGLIVRKAKKMTFTYSTAERNRILIKLLSLLLLIFILCSFSALALPVLTLLISSLGLILTLMFAIASSKRSL